MFGDDDCTCRACQEERRMKDAQSQRFWMCYVEGRNASAPVYKHLNSSDATTEAARLARLPNNLGKRAYVLKAIQYAQVDASNLPVQLTDL